MTRNTKLISSYKLLGISPKVMQSYYYDVPTKNIRRVAGPGSVGHEGKGQGANKPLVFSFVLLATDPRQSLIDKY